MYPDRRLQLFHLPKWTPRFLGETARGTMSEEDLTTWPPCQRPYFLKDEAEAALETKKEQTKQFEAFEKLSLQFEKKTSKKNA